MSATPDEQQGLTGKGPKLDSKGREIQAGIVVDEKQVKKALVPEGVSFLVEIAFCILVTVWNTANKNQLQPGMVCDSDTAQTIVYFIWGVFVFFIVGRIVCFVCWKGDHGPDNVWAALFMFCSTFQFIIYMACYYRLQEAWLYKHVNSKTLSMATGSGSELAPNSYSWDCVQFAAGDACDARTTVKGLAGAVKECCTIITYDLQTPGTTIVKGGYLQMSTAYSAIRWLSYLSMGFIWKDIPFVKSTAADKDFMANVWLDVLDAVLLGAVYVDSVPVLHHKYGIDPSSLRSTEPDEGHFEAVFYTWLVCFCFTLLSPTLYLSFQCLDKGDPVAKRTVDDVNNDLVGAVALLDDDKAMEYVHEAMKLQHKEYKAEQPETDHEEDVHVVIHFDEATGYVQWLDEEESENPFRQAKATLCHDANGHPIAGKYDVVYEDDDTEEKEVHVSRIIPSFEPQHYSRFNHFCVNWFHCDNLTNKPDNEYERIATWLDHIRTVFLLDIPFAIIRYKYASTSSMFGIFTDFMMLKNIIWGTINFCLILTCGKESATCCGFRVLSFFMRIVKGGKMSAPGWIGPGGLVRLGFDAVSNLSTGSIESQLQKLSLRRSWLILQMDKFDAHDGLAMTPDQLIYQAQITRLETKIAELKETQGFIHM